MAQEFEQTHRRPPYPMPPPLPFPETGLSAEATLDGIRERLSQDPYEVERNFGVSYVGPPHSITQQAGRVGGRHLFRRVGA